MNDEVEPESTKVYLLFQWTEEREGKDIFGVYSTLLKAKCVAQVDFHHECRDYGVTPRPLSWVITPLSTEWFAEGTAGDENGYTIEQHGLDMYVDMNTNPPTRKAI